MTADWRHRLVIDRLKDGDTTMEAAAEAGVSKVAVWMWRKAMPDFAQAVVAAREAGREERTFRQWLRPSIPGLSPAHGQGAWRETLFHLRAEMIA